MKTYAVTIPITGYVYIEVEAESKEDAEQKALSHDFSNNDIEEWDLHKIVCAGNVYHGQYNEIEIQEVD